MASLTMPRHARGHELDSQDAGDIVKRDLEK
jgi:hypothetical protein